MRRVLITGVTGQDGSYLAEALIARGDEVHGTVQRADELVTDALAREIQAAMAAPQADVYALPRRSYFLGRPMRHGGWWPDEVPRLFRRGKAHFSDDLVHERLVFVRAPEGWTTQRLYP